MDIPRILQKLEERGELEQGLEWGPLAQTRETYEKFVSMWPEKNPPPPNKVRMIELWQEISQEDRVKKNEDERDRRLALSTEGFLIELEKLLPAGNEWRLYREKLRAVDLANPEPTWPTKPS